MSVHKNPFDEHFRRRLSDLESPIPDDLFDRLQARRGGAMPSDAPLRERLEPHESPVSETIFAAVLTEREQRRRRRIVLWRTVTGIAALWLLGTLIVEFKNKNEALNTPNPTLGNAKINENTEGSFSELKNKNDALNTPNTTLKNGEINSELNTTNSELNKLNSDNNSVNNKDLKQQITLNKKADLNKKNIAFNYQKITKIQSNNTISSTNRGINAEFKNNNSTLNSTKTIANSGNTEGVNSELDTPNNSVLNNTKTIVNSENNPELNNTKISINSDNTEGSLSELNAQNKALETALNNRLSSPNFQTPTLDFLHVLDVKTVPFFVKKRDNPCADPGNGCPTFGSRRGGMRGTNFYVDAFVAPEYMMRSFKPNLVESEKLLAARDSIEKTQYSVSTGVRASVVFTNGMSLRAGVVFNQMNEKAQFDSLGIGSIRTTYDVRIVNGKPDTVSITTTIIDGIFRKIRYNRYRSIDIPLQIGYEMALKNGWTFGLNGGVNFNITAWRKADIVGADLRQQTVSSEINAPNPVFKNNLGISVIGSIAAYRQLTHGLQLVIEPSVRYGLQPITRSDYALKQQYSTAGLIVGLRLRL